MAHWEHFSLERFVGRDAELQDLRAWIDDPHPPKRARAIIGPAGTGKTWLLEMLREILRASRDTARDLIPVWIAFHEMASALVKSDAAYTELVHNWLAGILTEVNDPALREQDIPRDSMPRAMVEPFVAPLCDQRGLRLIFLLEGYDEVDPQHAKRIALDLVVPFVQQPRTRFLMGRRDDRLEGLFQITWIEEPFILAVQSSAEEQFRKLQPEHPNGDAFPIDQLSTLLALVPVYQWNHNFINAFLFSRALDRVGTPTALLTPLDLDECIQQLIGRGGPRSGPPFDLRQYDLLKQIARQLERYWTSQALEDTLKVRLHDIGPLFVYGAVHKYRPRTQRYCIADGLYELLAQLLAEEV